MSTTQTTAVRERSLARTSMYFILLSLLCCLVVLVGFEVFLRLTRDPNRFYPYHKNHTQLTFARGRAEIKNDSETPGVYGMAQITTNSIGCRGPEWIGEKYKLLTIGGSTTACSLLDDSEEWPHLVMRDVNTRLGDDHFLWVTNAGISGLNTRHHIMHAKYLVPKIKGLNFVLVYCGINDVGSWLYKRDFDPNYLDNPRNWDTTVAESFRMCNYTAPDAPWYKHLEIWKRASILKDLVHSRRAAEMRANGKIVEDARAEFMRDERAFRQKSKKELVARAKLATLGAALDSYARNLNTIIDLAQAAGVTPILMAQYTACANLSEEERKLIWMGAMNSGESYATEEQLQALVDQFNERMKQVVAARHVLFIDLPEAMKGKSHVFYDCMHFNEEGARETARVVSDFLIDKLGWEKTPQVTQTEK
jgi:lysophospholipase L1-like esterase